MKTIVVSLFMTVVLFSCSSDEGKIGRPNTYTTNNTGSGGGTGTSTTAPTPTDVPIDGGLSILLVAGAAYGVKRMKGKNKETV